MKYKMKNYYIKNKEVHKDHILEDLHYDYLHIWMLDMGMLIHIENYIDKLCYYKTNMYMWMCKLNNYDQNIFNTCY